MENDLVKFKVVMTSNATIKEVALATSRTKLSQLKEMLANEELFGSNAPVRRQRIFHLGRELKSGGRSLCNLGVGKFNNKIFHLYIRPATDEKDEITTTSKVKNSQQEGSFDVKPRKRGRPTSPSTRQYRQQTHERNEAVTETNNENITLTSRSMAPSSNHSGANNLPIDLVDSSDDDDDDVEIIELS